MDFEKEANKFWKDFDDVKNSVEAKQLIAKFLQKAFEAGLEEAAKIAEGYDSYDDKQCGDKSHDTRWCSHCESKNDGSDYVSQLIRQRISLKRPESPDSIKEK